MTLDDFKPLDLHDKGVFMEYLEQDPPQASEFTFTNFFIWRHHHRPLWKALQDCILVVLHPEGETPMGLAPFGPGDKEKAFNRAAEVLQGATQTVQMCRVAESFLHQYVDPDRYMWVLDRDHSDYVYETIDLIHLSGKRYHRKKNHLNRFIKSYPFEYQPLDQDLVECVLEMQAAWCALRECREKPDLLSEDHAVFEALTRFEELDYQGGGIVMEGKVEAFSIGEKLNTDTAVIHVEKANPDIPGLYAAINQQFCQHAWLPMTYVNREQDLGIEGLRKAKESYLPHHMVNKYRVTTRS